MTAAGRLHLEACATKTFVKYEEPHIVFTEKKAYLGLVSPLSVRSLCQSCAP